MDHNLRFFTRFLYGLPTFLRNNQVSTLSRGLTVRRGQKTPVTVLRDETMGYENVSFEIESSKDEDFGGKSEKWNKSYQ